MASGVLNKAKRQKEDEFYTQLSDIERELKNYKKHFSNKVIFCNCDDPEYSNYYYFFVKIVIAGRGINRYAANT